MPRRGFLRSVGRWPTLLLLFAHCAATAGTGPSDKSLQPLLLTANVNGVAAEEPQLFVRDGQGRVLVSEAFLRHWKLRVPPQADALFDEEKFFLLEASLPVRAKLSEADQSITIDAAGELFERQKTAFSNHELIGMTEPGKGFFMNYDMVFERTDKRISASGAFEVGVFHPLGVGSTRFIGNAGPARRNLVRLDTNWVVDRPDSMTSLRLGDGISSGTTNARPVRFAGVQYATSFATQPGFVTMPLRSVSGSAAVPSVIDIYVNNVLQGSKEVTPGPFDITGVPLQSGGGNIQLVVRDLLGRQIITDHNYYASSQLLRKGLSEFSYEAGLLRRNFGTRSVDYGGPMASVVHRYGLNDQVTVEGVAQASRSTQVAGAGLTAILGNAGLASGSVNFSNSRQGTGQSVSFSLERRARGPSFGARADVSTRNYAQLGASELDESAKYNIQAFVDLPLKHGAIGLNYIRRSHHRDDDGERSPSESLAGVFASTTLGRFGSLQIYARRSSIGPGKTVFGSHLTMPFGGGRSGGASVEYRRGQKQLNVSMQKDLPIGQGFGYRSSFSMGEATRGEAALLMNTGAASVSIETAKTRDSSGIRLSAAGAVGMIGDTPFASRRLGDSFAAVKVKGMKDVRVYADNQLVGTTNSSGALIIPMMRAYERNTIRLDEADFPLDVQIEKTEMAVRPFARAGTFIQFGVRRERGALLQIVLEDGSKLPAGARVFVEGAKVGHVAVSGGEVYIPDLVGRARLSASWDGRACAASVHVPQSDDPQPRIEGLVCTAVAVVAAR
jgi:outer membrane usher protein